MCINICHKCNVNSLYNNTNSDNLRLFELNRKRGLDDAIMHTKYICVKKK